MKKSIFISLLGLVAMLLSACQPDVITATGLTITPDSKTIAVGETVTLNVTVTPENAENTNYQLTVDNPDVATLEGNVLTALAEGTATVTATLGDLKATAVFTVEEPAVPVTAMEITLSANEVEVGKTITATVKVLPENATDKNYTLSVNDTDIATVSGNEITGVSVGEVTVFAKLGDVMASVNLNVVPAVFEATGLEVILSDEEVEVGENVTVTVNVLPDNATDKNYTLSVDNPEIAVLEGNVLKTKAVGTVTVTARLGSLEESAALTVINATAATTGIKIDPKTSELYVGYTLDFNVYVLPDNATDKSYTLTVNDPALAAIEGNTLTALAPGTVTVTATQGEFSDQATITIVEADFTEVTVSSCSYTNSGQDSYDLVWETGLHTLYVNFRYVDTIFGTHSFTYDSSSYAFYHTNPNTWSPVYSDAFDITITDLGDGDYSIDAMITFVDGSRAEVGKYHYTFNGPISGL